MKFSLSNILLTLTTLAGIIMTAKSSRLRGRNLQSSNVEGSNLSAPSIKIVGVSTLLKILNEASEFTNATFDVITIDSFITSTTEQGITSEATVTLENDQGVNVTGVINGVWDPVTNKIAFNVSRPPVETEESDSGESDASDIEIDNGQNSTNSTDGTNSTDIDNNSTIVDNSTEIVNNSTNFENQTETNTNSTDNTNTTNTTITPAVPAGYTWLSPDDLDNNTIAQGALQNGSVLLVNRLIAIYKLPAASPQYNITNNTLAAYKNTSYGSAYVFTVNMINALKYKVDANITIRYWASNKTYILAGYSYHAYNFPPNAIVIPSNNTNATNNTGNGNATNTNNATTNGTAPSNGTVTNPSNTTTNNTSPGNVTQPTNSTGNDTNNTTSPTNTTSNNTSSSNNTANLTADGYTIYTAAQLSNDSQALGALQNGTATMVQKGVNQYKIPTANANYTINNITLAAYKKQMIGTYYKFNVNMTNIDYVHVDANVTVLYRYSTKAYILSGYSFRSYNYSASALNGGTPNPDPPLIDNAGGSDIPIIIEDDSTSNSGAR